MCGGLRRRNGCFSLELFIDLLCSIPYDFIFKMIVPSGENASGIALLRIARALKGIKMLRLNKLLRGSLYELYEDAKAKSSTVRFGLKLTQLVIMMCFTFHVVGSFWHLVAMTALDDQENWITGYFGVEKVRDMPFDERHLTLDYMALHYIALHCARCATCRSTSGTSRASTLRSRR